MIGGTRHEKENFDTTGWRNAFGGNVSTADGGDKQRGGFNLGICPGNHRRQTRKNSREGSTSVQYQVHVYRGNNRSDENLIFSTHATYVNIDQNGQKVPLKK